MYHIFVNLIHIYSKIHPCTPKGWRKKALHFIHEHLIQLISITTFHPRAIGTEPWNIGRRPFPVYFLTLGSFHDDVAEIHYRHRSAVVDTYFYIVFILLFGEFDFFAVGIGRAELLPVFCLATMRRIVLYVTRKG